MAMQSHRRCAAGLLVAPVPGPSWLAPGPDGLACAPSRVRLARVDPSLTPNLGSRSVFPDLTARAYLNHAAISPVAAPVRAAVQAALDDYARQGSLAFPQWMEDRVRTRAAFAKLVNSTTRNVALVYSATRGIVDVALAFPWRLGDRVVLFEGEFPANVTPWQTAARAFGIELVFHRADDFRDGRGLERLEAELKRGVRLVAVSAVQFQTGLRMPLPAMGALCERYGAAFAVDAIQACGVVPVDVQASKIDFLTTSTHKWLLGVEGGGFLCVHERWHGQLKPLTAGWLSHEDGADFLFKGQGHLRYDRALREDASVFEGGTSSLLAYAAVGASLQMLLTLGVENIYGHVAGYLDELEAALLARGFVSLRSPHAEARSGCLCVQPPGITAVELAARLRAKQVVTATPDGNLRFSPHFANPRSEIESVLGAVDECLGV